MDRKVWYVAIIILAVFALSGGLYLARRANEKAHPPTPTPTPCIQVNGVGGMGFFVENPKMVERLAELGYCVNILSNSGYDTWPNPDAIDYKDVNFLQPGAFSAEQEMITKFEGVVLPSTGDPKKIMTTVVFARTPYPFFGKRELVEAMVDAGLAYMDGPVYRITAANTQVLFDADVNNALWETLGVDYPGPVKIGFPNPARSSGGRITTGYALTCADGDGCQYAVTPEQMEDPFFQNYLVQLIRNAAQVPGRDDSLAFCLNFFDQDSNPTPLIVAGESCYAQWGNKLTENQKTRNADANVAIYPEILVVNQFPLIPLDAIGKQFADTVANDDVIRQILSESGLQAGSYNNPPVDVAPWIDADAKYQVVSDPLPQVMSKIKQIIRDYDEGKFGQ